MPSSLPRPVVTVPSGKTRGRVGPFLERRHDAAERPHLLLREAGALQHRAERLDRVRPLLRRAEEAGRVERRFEMLEQPDQVLLRRRDGPSVGKRQCPFIGRETGQPPLVAEQQHRLGEVERGEARIDREGQDLVGERQVLVVEPGPLAAEQDARPAPRASASARMCIAASRGPATGFATSRVRAVVA